MLPDTDWTGFGQCQAGLNSLSQPRDERFFNALAASGMFSSIPSSVTCLEAFLTEFLPLKTAGFSTVDCSTCCLLEIQRLAHESIAVLNMAVTKHHIYQIFTGRS